MRNSLGAYRQHPCVRSFWHGFHLRMGPSQGGRQRRHAGGHVDEAATAFGDPLGRIVDDPRHSTAEPRLVLLGYSVSDRLLASCSPSAVTAFASLAPGKRLVANATPMKKAPPKRPPRLGADDILPEYDFSRGRRNRYAARLAGGHIVVLEPDVAAVFPDASAVNDALRALAGIIRGQRRKAASRRLRRRKSRRGSA